ARPADQTERTSAGFLVADVTGVSLGDAHVAVGQTVHQTRQIDDHQPAAHAQRNPYGIPQRRSEEEQQVCHNRPDLADDQDRTATPTVTQLAEYRRGNEL